MNTFFSKNIWKHTLSFIFRWDDFQIVTEPYPDILILLYSEWIIQFIHFLNFFFSPSPLVFTFTTQVLGHSDISFDPPNKTWERKHTPSGTSNEADTGKN